jgi:hypothetical protein
MNELRNCDIYKMKFYSAIKDDVDSKWMQLEVIMVSEISHVLEDMPSFLTVSRKGGEGKTSKGRPCAQSGRSESCLHPLV